MISLYFISAICNALMLICNIFILIHPHLSVKKYPVFFLSFTAFYFMQWYLNFSPMFLIMLAVNSILLVKFSKKLYSIFYIPLGYILDCILLDSIGFAANTLWNLPLNDFGAAKISIIIFSICTIIAGCPVFYLIRRVLQRYLIKIFEKMNQKLLALVTFPILFFACLLFIVGSFLDILEATYVEFLLMLSLFILYSVCTISMILFVLYSAKKNNEALKKVEYLENLNEYTRNLEIVYNNLRSFRHDYINIMTSLAAYIDEKKYDELEIFFYEHILPMQKNLTQKNGALNSLLHIKILELKSIVYTKLLLAVNQDIEVNIDIPDEIASINMDSVDLTRVLGIYLDNAIEGCLETEHPIINFHLGKMNQDIVFIISNTFIDKGLSISQMHKKDVTTKGDGHGIGLHNVSEILNRYDNIYHETLIKEDLFIQQVQIS